MKLESARRSLLMKFMSKSFFRFIFVGGIVTLTSYLVYLLLLKFIDYLYAYTCAFLIGVILSYLLNSLIVFEVSLSLKKLTLFPTVYLVQYLIGTFIIYVFVGRFQVDERLGPILAVIISVPVTYSLSKFILRPHKHRTY
jgi:putative flippase GtrA